MQLFHNDYNVMCHSAVHARLAECSADQVSGYGVDPYCDKAADKIKKLCNREDISVHFLVGGTQANLTVIAASLRPYQGVIGAVSAHINVHETGAIEATGHKVIGLPSEDGKISADQVERLVLEQSQSDDAEHIVQPKMVYISDSTELGTIYKRSELEELSAVCKKHGLYLYLDGARLSYALEAADSDVTLADLARLCDVFYIGGTKCGAMFGEGVVISNPQIAADFRYMIKQRGGMLAKGWLLGVQFDALMEDGLYFKIAKQANVLADQIRSTLKKCGYQLVAESTTNQIFVVMPATVLERISQDFSYSAMEWVDKNHRVVRFCTSWATAPESVEALCKAIEKYSNR